MVDLKSAYLLTLIIAYEHGPNILKSGDMNKMNSFNLKSKVFFVYLEYISQVKKQISKFIISYYTLLISAIWYEKWVYIRSNANYFELRLEHFVLQNITSAKIDNLYCSNAKKFFIKEM